MKVSKREKALVDALNFIRIVPQAYNDRSPDVRLAQIADVTLAALTAWRVAA